MPIREKAFRLGLHIIGLVASRDIRDAILGDLEERYDRAGGDSGRLSRMSFLREFAFSFAFLLLDRVRRSGAERGARTATLFCVVGGIAMAWEWFVVQSHAWPVAAHILQREILPARLLYFAIHIAIYLAGCFAIILLGLGICGAHGHARRAHAGLLALIGAGLSVPPLLFLVVPDSFDAPSFRLSQAAAVWFVCAFVLFWPKRPGAASREAQ